jgi:hypothetical protein
VIDPRFSSELTPERLKLLREGRDPREQAREALHQSGVVHGGTPGAKAYRPRVLHANPAAMSARWPYAVMRLKRIMEGASASSFDRAVQTSECPDLAKAYAETWLYYMTRTRPAPLYKIDHNPFRGLSDIDASRKFMRLCEDICDRSSSRLGTWFAK